MRHRPGAACWRASEVPGRPSAEKLIERRQQAAPRACGPARRGRQQGLRSIALFWGALSRSISCYAPPSRSARPLRRPPQAARSRHRRKPRTGSRKNRCAGRRRRYGRGQSGPRTGRVNIPQFLPLPPSSHEPLPDEEEPLMPAPVYVYTVTYADDRLG